MKNDSTQNSGLENLTEEKKIDAAPGGVSPTGKKRWFGRGIYGSRDVPIRALDTCIGLMIVAAIVLTVINANMGGFAITFDTGMSDVTVPAQKVHHGETVAEPEAPIRPGYVLEGWSATADGKAAWVWSTPVENDMTFYALWQPAQVAVKFDLAGGTINGADAAPDQTVTYGEPYGTLPTPQKTGSSFVGWQYSGQPITETTTVQATGEHVLTAVWQ